MQNNSKKNQTSVGLMIGRCHKWRLRRKQYIDQARQTADSVERERLLQMAEHYGRNVSGEQGKIDGVKERAAPQVQTDENPDDDDSGFPDFIKNI